MNKKVIVTGGAGFIGSHATDLLVKEGYSVVVFDNLLTGCREYVNKKAQFIKIDITDSNKVFKAVSEIRPCAICHLAALPRIVRSVNDPIGTNNINVAGTLVMLEAAKINKIRRFVYSSSSSVYGQQKSYLLKESFTPHPISHYALQKLMGEMYCSFYAGSFGMEIVSLRYFNVYGERQPDSGIYSLVIGKFLKKIGEEKKLPVYGDGTQTRDFTFVFDVARANLLSLTSNLPSGRNTILNIGTSKETSINQIVEYLGGVAEYIVPNPREEYEEKRKAADIRSAKKVLGWEPKVMLEEGLKKLQEKMGLF